MFEDYTITEEIYFPDKPVKYLAISYELSNLKLLHCNLNLFIFLQFQKRDCNEKTTRRINHF